jgi:membrane-associated phospholipid phosphatase
MDQWLLQLTNGVLVHPLLDIVMVAVTLGALPLLPLVGWRMKRRQWLPREQRLERTVWLALFFTLFLTVLFYYLALRPRPTEVRFLLPAPPFPSYPSGHSALAFTVATVLALALRRWSVIGMGLVGALVVGYSRLYLGHHYFSDVVGGAVLGVAVGASTYGWRHEGDSLVARLRWLVWVQVAIVLMATQMAYLGLQPNHLLAWPLADKVLHALLFGAVVFWLNLWLTDRRVRVGWWSAPLAIVIPFGVALLEEGLQAFSPLRTADPADLASDLVGMICFWWLSYRLLLGEAQSLTE